MVRNRTSQLIVTVLAIATVACSDGPTALLERVVTLDVAAQRVACIGGEEGARECLRVREHPDTGWTLLFDEIEGFVFEPGFEYTIRVSIRRIPNPPADGSSLAYRLLEVLRKVPDAPNLALP